MSYPYLIVCASQELSEKFPQSQSFQAVRFVCLNTNSNLAENFKNLDLPKCIILFGYEDDAQIKTAIQNFYETQKSGHFFSRPAEPNFITMPHNQEDIDCQKQLIKTIILEEIFQEVLCLISANFFLYEKKEEFYSKLQDEIRKLELDVTDFSQDKSKLNKKIKNIFNKILPEYERQKWYLEFLDFIRGFIISSIVIYAATYTLGMIFGPIPLMASLGVTLLVATLIGAQEVYEHRHPRNNTCGIIDMLFSTEPIMKKIDGMFQPNTFSSGF